MRAHRSLLGTNAACVGTRNSRRNLDALAGSVRALRRWNRRAPGIGKVMLDDGASVSGFSVSPSVEDAVEITALGGWRRYIESQA